jgi:CDP-diacylglycerol---serine O-phosphatidyltransferase
MYNPVKKQIPNLFTLGNLSCGVMAILSIFQEDLEQATLWTIAAAVLDFFDGFLARLLKVSGELGKQLDSLADMVTFGVAPGFMLFALSENVEGYARYAFLLVPIFSAYRLAKFNIDTRQSTSFIGVPTPITGIMCMSWGFIDDDYREYIFDYPWIFVLFCVVVSLLLVSRLKLPSLKLKKGPLADYTKHLVLLGIGLISLLFFGWLCIPIFYAAYVLSAVTNIFKRPGQN